LVYNSSCINFAVKLLLQNKIVFVNNQADTKLYLLIQPSYSTRTVTPTITTFSCVASPFAAVVRGTSENGATITLYQLHSAGTVLGTGTVSGGTWSIVPPVFFLLEL
jgi:hypothetical protein